MNETDFSEPGQPTLTETEWESIRASFMGSIMVDTQLDKLAENLGVVWPYEGSDETPAKYIDRSYDELLMMKGFQRDPAQVDLLVSILKDTMAFDDPFGEMVQNVDANKADETAKILAKMGIPMEFPLEYCYLSADTHSFCQAEEIKTIGDFVEFSQNMAQNVVVGGDFRELLNGIANNSPDAVAGFVPIRRGHNGVFLCEAIGLAIKSLDNDTLLELYRKYGGKLNDEEETSRRKLLPPEVDRAEAGLNRKFNQLFAYFKDQKGELDGKLAEGVELERYFMALDNRYYERVASGMIKALLKGSAKPDSAKGGKPGFFARLFGRK